MQNSDIVIKERSIKELFLDKLNRIIFEIPIYQRNYAWGKEEIKALIQDIFDSYSKKNNNDNNDNYYYLGTLVTFNKGNNKFEIIDGQQRLTTLFLILLYLKEEKQIEDIESKLTFKSRTKSEETLKSIPNFNADYRDDGIFNGYKYIKSELWKIVNIFVNKEEFVNYLLNNVHIIHYEVPKDVDLNQYFEIMNSRGEQLEKHEIIKANLMKKISENDKPKFALIWDECSKLGNYIQHSIDNKDIFAESLSEFIVADNVYDKVSSFESIKSISINDILEERLEYIDENNVITKDQFKPIVDFENFLLLVLKIFKYCELGNNGKNVQLDDKELEKGFYSLEWDEATIEKFALYMLKVKYYLDNFIVHQYEESEKRKENPWNLEVYIKDKNLKNLCENVEQNNNIRNLLSMFESTYPSKQRKNYLFYILYFLVKNNINREYDKDLKKYECFLELLAKKFFFSIYIDKISDNFDEAIDIVNFAEDFNNVNVNVNIREYIDRFNERYGDGSEGSSQKEKPSEYIFNYLDYKIWKLYNKNARGVSKDNVNKNFYEKLGISNNIFFDHNYLNRGFYFSTTRDSLEHFYPRAKVDENMTDDNINCFGNFAYIGSSANSTGSNFDPQAKVKLYIDKKIDQVSVGSLKFRIMLNICKNKESWNFDDIKSHQEKMLEILLE